MQKREDFTSSFFVSITMNFENPTPTTENESRFPLLDEIEAKIEQLCGDENPEIVRTLEDENGVYLYEVVTQDDKGDASLFSYRRDVYKRQHLILVRHQPCLLEPNL